MAFPSGWQRRCLLTLDRTVEDGFPVLLTQANLPSEMLDADGSNAALEGGGDIRFSSDIDGATQLPCEVVSFVRNNNPALGTAQIWVRCGAISSLYVWYKKAGESQPLVTEAFGRNATWDKFHAVYHLETEPNNTASEITDSTGNYHLTGEGMSGTELESGVIGNRLTFNGTSQRLSLSPTTIQNNFSREVATLSDWEVPGASTFTNTGLAYDTQDDALWICDWTNGKLVKTDLNGTELTSLTIGSSTSLLQGVAYDSSDNTLWVSMVVSGSRIIRHFNKSGTNLSEDIAVGSSGNGCAYLASADQIWSIPATTGKSVAVWSCSTRTQVRTVYLTTGPTTAWDHIAIDQTTGNLWLTANIGSTASQIWVFNSRGSFLYRYTVAKPYIEGITFSPTGDAYVCCDAEFHGGTADGNRVFKLDLLAADVSTDTIGAAEWSSGGCMSCWSLIDAHSGTDVLVTSGEPVNQYGVGIFCTTSTNLRVYTHDQTTRVFTDRTVSSLASRRHIAWLADQANNRCQLYVDGAQAGADISISTQVGNFKVMPLYVANDSTTRWLDAHIDEVRITKAVVSANWIDAEYDTVNAPATFVTVGTPADVTPTISWLTPTADQIVFVGTSTSVTWDEIGISFGTILIEYSSDNGLSWSTLATVATGLETYSWTPTSAQLSSTAKLRVTWSGAVSATSDAFKTVTTTASGSVVIASANITGFGAF